ncbi:hypothetical protein BAT_3192 [Bacillus pumilus ATCC 7061]|nr:hypothetical protein BAT_3192 [Bacillus pumilus ATCC 7061]
MYPFSSLKKLRPIQQHIASPFIIWMKREAYETTNRYFHYKKGVRPITLDRSSTD